VKSTGWEVHHYAVLSMIRLPPFQIQNNDSDNNDNFNYSSDNDNADYDSDKNYGDMVIIVIY